LVLLLKTFSAAAAAGSNEEVLLLLLLRLLLRLVRALSRELRAHDMPGVLLLLFGSVVYVFSCAETAV
jgi:hypothetical protein